MKGTVTQTSPLRVRLASSNSDAPAMRNTNYSAAQGDEVYVVAYDGGLLVVCAVTRV